MSITNYSTLKSAIIDFDGSNAISNSLDTMILLAETEMFSNETANLRIRDMESRETATLSTSSRFVELPDLFLEMRRLHIVETNDYSEIYFSTPQSLPLNTVTGKPKYFTVTSQIELDRVPDSAYTIEMQLIKKPAALTSSAPTNSIITNYPNIYLFGCLWAVNQRNGEQDVAEYYYSKFITAIRGANKNTRDGAFGPSPRVQRKISIA